MPSPLFASFTQGNEAEALAWWKSFGADIVVKQSGLAGGKGVVVPTSAEETTLAIREAIAVGDIVLEERLTGTECSLIAVSDGKTSVAFPLAQDHKRIGEGDTGLNTGGMGAYAPAPVPLSADELHSMFITPVINHFAAAGTPFTGTLFAGIMLTANGPRLLEYNCRFGDPEAQVLLSLLESDLVDLLLACTTGSLKPSHLSIREGSALGVVLASSNYRNAKRKSRYRRRTRADMRGSWRNTRRSTNPCLFCCFSYFVRRRADASRHRVARAWSNHQVVCINGCRY
jgi:phosphoribosylamine--glycine ligase